MQKCQMKGIPPQLRNIVLYAAKLLPVSHHPFKVGQHHAVLLFPLFFFFLCALRTTYLYPTSVLQPFLWDQQLTFHITQMFSLQSQTWSLLYGGILTSVQCFQRQTFLIYAQNMTHSYLLMWSLNHSRIENHVFTQPSFWNLTLHKFSIHERC